MCVCVCVCVCVCACDGGRVLCICIVCTSIHLHPHRFIVSHTNIGDLFPSSRYQHKDGSIDGCIKDVFSGKAVGMFLEEITTQ